MKIETFTKEEWKLLENYLATRFRELLLAEVIFKSEEKAHKAVEELKESLNPADKIQVTFNITIDFTLLEAINNFRKGLI